jgi:DNA-binding transcriptional MerR regulator
VRRYSEDDLARVRRIRELQSLLGFNLDEIRAVLDNDDRLAQVRAEYRSTHTGTARRRELLEEGLTIHQKMGATIDAKLAALQRFRAEVDASVQRTEELLAEWEGGARTAAVGGARGAAGAGARVGAGGGGGRPVGAGAGASTGAGR